MEEEGEALSSLRSDSKGTKGKKGGDEMRSRRDREHIGKTQEPHTQRDSTEQGRGREGGQGQPPPANPLLAASAAQQHEGGARIAFAFSRDFSKLARFSQCCVRNKHRKALRISSVMLEVALYMNPPPLRFHLSHTTRSDENSEVHVRNDTFRERTAQLNCMNE